MGTGIWFGHLMLNLIHQIVLIFGKRKYNSTYKRLLYGVELHFYKATFIVLSLRTLEPLKTYENKDWYISFPIY